MKFVKPIMMVTAVMILSFIGLHALEQPAFAADSAQSWRPTFDLVMRWLNFAILAFLIIKYARTPIRDFFKSRKLELADEIEKLEKEKKDALREVDENLKLLEDSTARFKELKQRISDQGERNKQKIIQEAQQESKIMLEGAKQKIEYHLIKARNKLKVELIDSAIAIAIERLPGEMTAEDNQKWIDKFLASTNK